MSIKIYKDSAANAIFIEDANGVQFLNSLQAVEGDGVCSIHDLAKGFDIVSDAPFSDYVDSNGLNYGNDVSSTVNALNAVFSASGTNTGELPSITSSLSVNLTQGETLNYELTADYGVGYEWDNLPSGVVTVDGNVRKIVGGTSLATGTYTVGMKAINYNGEDAKNLIINVSTPPFANTKSVNFNNNDFLGANAAILDGVLGRSSNGSGSGDAWTISFWFKGGTATNASQTIVYFGSQDVANQGHIQIKYNGSLKRIEMRYGTNNNRLNFTTQSNSLTVGQWHHVIISYDGGTTGSSSGSINSYYSRFKFFLDGSDVTSSLVLSNNNYGYTGSIIGQNFRVGKYNNGQSMRNNCRVDELAVFDSDVSSTASAIYNNGQPLDLMSLTTKPKHWWRMGDGDTYPYLMDSGTENNCIFVMNNMVSSDIVSDTP